jgi:hypothetical protein
VLGPNGFQRNTDAVLENIGGGDERNVSLMRIECLGRRTPASTAAPDQSNAHALGARNMHRTGKRRHGGNSHSGRKGRSRGL